MFQSKSIKIIIIDEDPQSAFLLRQYLFDLFFKDIHVFSDAKSGMEAIKLLKPDIIFLEIMFKDEHKGIDILKIIETTKLHTHIIVTTENIKLIYDVIKYSIIDFLPKPVCFEDLRLSIKKVEQHNNLHNDVKIEGIHLKSNQLVEINSNKEISFYHPQNVVSIEADGNYSHIQLVDGTRDTVSQNLGKLVDKFSADFFVRVSRKSIVNIHFLKKLNKQTGELELEFNGYSLKIITSKKYFHHKY